MLPKRTWAVALGCSLFRGVEGYFRGGLLRTQMGVATFRPLTLRRSSEGIKLLSFKRMKVLVKMSI